MSTYRKVFGTKEEQVCILTKTRWLGFVPMPHTSVTPRSADDLKRLGTFIKWTTSDPTTLAALHDAIVRLVEQIGLSGLAEIGNSVRMATGVARRLSAEIGTI